MGNSTRSLVLDNVMQRGHGMGPVNLGLKAENVHIVFNNNRSNYAPKSAEQLQRILEIDHEIKNVRPKVLQPSQCK